MDLYQDIQNLMKELTVSIKLLRINGNTLAAAERDYKIKLRQEALRLRAENDMPVSLIDKVIYGLPEVAEMRFKRDVAKSTYDTNLEQINIIKLKLRILENQLSREYGAAGKDNL